MADDHQPPASTRLDTLKTAAARSLDDLCAAPLPAGLYLVATPIGNLGDISLRALATLAGCSDLYCEDTRTSQVLLSRYAINRKLRAYHEHNAQKVRPEIIEAIAGGRSVALISDAGTPAVSDPGFKLATAVIDAGFPVVPVPGPSAVVAAVSAAGLPTDRFLFAGFLSQKSASRRRQLTELADVSATLIVYESPHRLAATLQDMAEILGQRSAVVARELTKRYEEFKRAPLQELAGWARETPPRGEITILVGPRPEPAASDVTDSDIAEQLRLAQNSASPSQAAKQIADMLGVAKSRVYDVGLRIKRGEL